MWHMALMNSGFNIDEPNTFTDPLQRLINVGFGLDRNQPIEEIEVEIEEDEPPKEDDKPAEEEEEIVLNADNNN